MAGDEQDYDDDERSTQSTRRPRTPTDRLPTREVPRGEPVRSDWLSSRTAGRSSQRRSSMPSSRQEFVLWLQHGGWRTVALVAAATFAAIMLMAVLANRANPGPLVTAEPTPEFGAGVAVPTLDPLFQPSVTPATAATAAAATSVEFKVINTDAQGLFLRADHAVDPGNIVETIPDGSTVTIIGEDFVGTDRVWKHIRSSSGKEGWAASDFLQQVQS